MRGRLIELDPIDLSDGDARDLDARPHAEAGGVVEDGIDAVAGVAAEGVGADQQQAEDEGRRRSSNHQTDAYGSPQGGH